MKDTRLLLLFNRAIEQTITSEEREELFSLLADEQNKQYIEGLFHETWTEFESDMPVFENEVGAKMLQGILGEGAGEQFPSRPRRILTIRRIIAAACILLLMTTAILLIDFPKKPSAVILAQSIDNQETFPGTESATITLGDGSTILLDDTQLGIITEERGMSLQKSKNGQISYVSSSVEIPKEMATLYHTVQVPKGGSYQLTLSDGTEVYLNSASSLRYPIRFTGDRREVVLTGEAYFSVNHTLKDEPSMEKTAIPFLVKTATQQVTVLGTEFNINAYGEDPVKTALVEGSIHIRSTSGKTVLLRPGQMAINKQGGANFDVIKADLDGELAWRSGYFIFKDEPIEHIMVRLARWYDVEVEYRGDVRSKRFGGVFQRSKSLSQLLESFKNTGLIDFKIEGRRVVVMPN